MINDLMYQFRDAICATGLEPPAFIEAGRLHRFPGMSKRLSNRAGWCILFEDGRGGSFGDWSSGFKAYWQAKQTRPLSKYERDTFTRKIKAKREQNQAQLITKQAETANKALAIWHRSTAPNHNHPYLLRKGIKTNGAKQYKEALLLPVVDFNKKLTSLQFIDPNGDKRLLSGGRKKGCFIPIPKTGVFSSTGISGSQRSHEKISAYYADIAYRNDEIRTLKIIICEGWATACTLAEHEPNAWVLAAIDTGNLEAVALGVRSRWPQAEITVAGDDDRLTPGNPGATKAKLAATVADALLALPQWPEEAPDTLTDFNDLAIWLTGVRP